jgi:DNA invertase Pin-like site-specific DNA recombinase
MAIESRPITAPPPALRAALLARVSSDTQLREGLGLDVQLDRGRDVISRNGWTPAGEFVDEGITGTMLDRPAVRELLTECQTGRVDVVVMAAASRMARDEVVDAQLRKALYDAGVAVCINDQVFQPTKEGMLNLGIQGVVAAYQRRDLIEQMAAGQHKRAQVGGWPGGPPPYGLRLEYPPRPDGGKPKPVAVVDPHEAEVITTAWRLIVTEGKSTWQAAAELNALGLTPRRSPRWVHNHLRRTLMNRSLIGEMTWGKPPRPGPKREGKTHRGTGKYGSHAVSIPTILTPSEWDALQAALARSTTPTPAKASLYMLSGRGHQHLIMPCGGVAHGVNDKRPGRGRTYRCANRRPELPPDEQCGCLRIDAEELEWWVRVQVLGLLQNPDLMSEAMRVWLEPEPAPADGSETPDGLDGRIAQLERALAGAYEAELRGGLDPQALAAATANITADLEALRGRRERMVAAQAAEAERQARLAELPRLAVEAMTWDDQQWRAFAARWDIHVHVVRWLTSDEMALRSPIGDPPPFPYLARVEGVYPRAQQSEAPRCWTCCRPPTPVTAVS